MAKNQATLLLAGDEDQLSRSLKKAQADVERLSAAIDDAADQAARSSKRMETVADASDHIDTLGSKATSSLGALSSGFELLGPQGEGAAKGLLTAALATDALSGAGEAATIATDTLKGALSKAKAAFSGLSTAAKVGVVSLGALGIAAAAAGAIFLAFKQHQAETKAQVDELSKSLDFQSDTFRSNNRQVIAAKLEERGLLEVAKKLGISQEDLTAAVLDGGAALDALVPKQVNLNKNSTEQAVLTKKLAEGTRELSAQVSLAKDQQDRLFNATERLTKANEAHSASIERSIAQLERQRQALHDELDPTANLFHRLQDVKKAQDEYTDAVKEHGRSSPEATEANVNLAEAILDAQDAARQAKGTFDGTLSPALVDLLKKAGATKEQVRGLETALRDTKKAGDKLDGQTFSFSVVETQKLIRSGGFDPPGRAAGGPVAAGGTYLVGERGPELVTFGASGFVHDAASTAAMASRPSEIHFHSNGGTFEDGLVAMFEKLVKQGRITWRAA